ncbi:hypothetical protein OVA10_08335 [Lelliottia sp. SL45]|uniref:hypothetical protein n=1 Tax=Lelliottia sp. SL45 TaxID=2994665 RepID=UPI002273F537|nr:hypothetical protein [Lelliottia sp. SL45]MCY1698065.1 hypothetical protein [Lelliottia sp. SL45]
MNKDKQQKTEPAIPLPPIHFFPLQRAAELTGCTTEDILQMAYTGAIDLCVLVRDCQAIVTIHGDVSEWANSPEEGFKHFIVEGNAFNKTEYHFTIVKKSPIMGEWIVPSHFKDLPEDMALKAMRQQRILKFRCKIAGLWALSHDVVSDLYLEGNVSRPITLFPLLEPRDGFAVTASPSLHELNPDRTVMDLVRVLEIRADDVLIARKDVESILSSYKEGKLISNFIERENPDKKEKDSEKGRVRVTAKQSDLIVSLLIGIGLTDNDLMGKISEIMKKANAKAGFELNFPDDSKSLATWLRAGGVER